MSDARALENIPGRILSLYKMDLIFLLNKVKNKVEIGNGFF